MRAGPRTLGAPAENGFTLIEVIGAFFMTIIILFFVTGIFIENGRQRAAASELLRVETTASAALELIAQDLEGAIYVSRPANRPAANHPWLFLAEASGEFGATRLRFQTQNVSRGNLGENASTWVDVVYFLTEEESEDRGLFLGDRYTLWRWRSTRPPSDPARRFPDVDDPGSARVAEGLATFGVTFVDSEGVVLDEWDSTLSTGEAPLPIAAEIRLALYQEAREGEAQPGVVEIPGRLHERQVSLPMHRPIDIDALIALANESGALTCSTIADCADLDDAWFVELRENGCDDDEDLCALLDASQETCWSEITNDWPSVADTASPDCENLP